MPDKRLLVVGTTADYIDHISTRYPGRALFITDPAERAAAVETDPEPADELRSDLQDSRRVLDDLKTHLSRWQMEISGVACYDCESLGLAARLAEQMRLPFPSPSSVSVSRNKFLSKKIWQSAELYCPDTIIARRFEDVTAFLEQQRRPIILKPLTGRDTKGIFEFAFKGGKASSTQASIFRN